MSETSSATAIPTGSSAPILPRLLRVLAWLSFIAEVIIIGTGGAVRLTASGLGCTEWPLCTPDSLVPTAEQGIHGIIEFGNRTMTGVVGILAIAVLLLTLFSIAGKRAVVHALWSALWSVIAGVLCLGLALLGGWIYTMITGEPGIAAFPFFSLGLLVMVIVGAVRSWRSFGERRDLSVLAWLVLIGVIAQAFVGGITVLTGLNPFIVGFHYVVSLLLVCITAVYLVRMRTHDGPRVRAVPKWFAVLTHITGLALAATIFFGVLTTASGPHSGDENVIRDGFDATVLAHVHAWPGYILAVLVLILTIAAWILRLDPRTWLVILVAAILVQIGVGVWQAREGLPEILVGIHMVLASLSAAAYTVVVLRLKRSADA
ncbi:COX15/CtaA family protein [uncultured Microbacterium sp.]|uniref:COX15/CtaA family protein n=1 Tax=uncultured Microbacterium sp. TaxID=191216 RepID=UPI002617ED34|nr:COX15/CtaA family protein [uncultured Microbacterium sp.]